MRYHVRTVGYPSFRLNSVLSDFGSRTVVVLTTRLYSASRQEHLSKLVESLAVDVQT